MVTAVEREPCTVGCSHVAAWQVIVLNLVGKRRLELEPQVMALDFRNSGAYCDPSDVALGGGCVIAQVDECSDFLEYS